MAASQRSRRKVANPTGDAFSPEKTWQELSKNIKDILNHNISHLSFEENYRSAYRLVLYKSGDLLYNGVKGLVIENLESLANNMVIPAFPVTTDDPVRQRTEEELLLKALREAWDYHATNMRFLSDILRYMDRNYIRSANVPSIRDMGSGLFVTHIINKPSIKAQVVIAISNQLQREKDGYVINRAVVEECVDVFLNLEAFKRATAGERYAESVLPQQGQEAEPPTSSYEAAEILRLIHRSVFATMVSPTDDEDESNPLSNTGSEYSFAPSRTDTTDYGIYARRMALSQVTFQTDFSDDG